MYRIRVMGYEDLSVIRKAAAEIDDQIQGLIVPVNFANIWKLHTKQMKDLYNKIFKVSHKKVHIKWIGKLR